MKPHLDVEIMFSCFHISAHLVKVYFGLENQNFAANCLLVPTGWVCQQCYDHWLFQRYQYVTCLVRFIRSNINFKITIHLKDFFVCLKFSFMLISVSFKFQFPIFSCSGTRQRGQWLPVVGSQRWAGGAGGMQMTNTSSSPSLRRAPWTAAPKNITPMEEATPMATTCLTQTSVRAQTSTTDIPPTQISMYALWSFWSVQARLKQRHKISLRSH